MSQINKEGNYTLTSFDKVRIVMVNTTEPGNIGAAARAMKNMMLTQLYLVAPSNYPSAVATARASGADDVLSNAIVCSSLEEGIELIWSLCLSASSASCGETDIFSASVRASVTTPTGRVRETTTPLLRLTRKQRVLSAPISSAP